MVGQFVLIRVSLLGSVSTTMLAELTKTCVLKRRTELVSICVYPNCSLHTKTLVHIQLERSDQQSDGQLVLIKKLTSVGTPFSSRSTRS